MAIQRQLHVTNSGKKLNVTKQPCHARTLATSAITFITNNTKNAVGGQMLRKPIFLWQK